MNEKTMNQIEEMKKQTIGVEVEMNSITRQAAAKLAADYFGTSRYEDTAIRNGYCTWSAWDAQGREWKFQKDVSIAGADSQKCEMVTPILTYSDMETLQDIIRLLRKAGAKSDASRGCGVHIHIGAKGHTAQTLRKDAENELPNFGEVIWDEEIPAILANCRELGIHEFTISSTFSSLIQTIATFEELGCTLDGIVRINSRYEIDWACINGEQAQVRKQIPAFKMSL